MSSFKIKYSEIFIIFLSCFLVIYHSLKIYSFLSTANDPAIYLEDSYIQILIRLGIITSMILVIFHIKFALILMWLFIALLVVLQILGWAGFNSHVHHLAPLKGFIIPTLITVMKLKSAKN